MTDMPARRRASIRLWQSGMFIVVIVVAMLVLSGSLSAGLTATLVRMADTSELRNAYALTRRLAPEFPLGRIEQGAYLVLAPALRRLNVLVDCPQSLLEDAPGVFEPAQPLLSRVAQRGSSPGL